ncbi:MAG TPA: RNB domain-containing ribonuclease [Solirubrobacteraceae bacterium]|nr:RNB domain-containing ribonuclease [Solirubrobacteraceae bacterium]
MPSRWIRVDPAAALRDGFEAIRREAGVPARFAPEAEAEAAAAAAQAPARDRLDLPFVTIDPPGARDLDQALHIARRGGGHRVSYAIADVGGFVAPGGALDREAHARGVTVYAPDAKTPLHPPVLSEGAASLLPGEWRPAVVWTLDVDAAGELTAAHVARAEVRSVAQHTYEDVPPEVEPLLREVGERRLAIERARGGVRLNVPEQEVVLEDGAWTVRYRAPLPAEEHNAQVSLLTGMAAARLMLDAGVGILRTQPPPDERALARLRRTAAALGVPWCEPYAEFIGALDPADPAHAAVMQEAAGAGRGAGYTAFDGDPPADAGHFAIAAPYGHATAPLRRLQDRHVLECCLAAAEGRPPPGPVRAALPGLPAAMAAGTKRARTVERGVVDLVEAVLLQGREGERFDAVVIDEDVVQLRDPAVRGRLERGCPEPGTEVVVRLERADPGTRTVAFSTP